MSWLRNTIPVTTYPPAEAGGSDAELVAQARQGDARAFALLYHRYVDRVYDFAAVRVATREAAEDATQTIFLKALHSLHTCRDGEFFAGWLFAIARNVVTDTYRTGRTPVTPLDDTFDLEDPSAQPETVALAADWTRQIEQLRRDCLNQRERDLLDLRLQDLSDREIATALNRSYGAIRTAQYRLVQRLRQCLGLNQATGEAEHADV